MIVNRYDLLKLDRFNDRTVEYFMNRIRRDTKYKLITMKSPTHKRIDVVAHMDLVDAKRVLREKIRNSQKAIHCQHWQRLIDEIDEVIG